MHVTGSIQVIRDTSYHAFKENGLVKGRSLSCSSSCLLVLWVPLCLWFPGVPASAKHREFKASSPCMDADHKGWGRRKESGGFVALPPPPPWLLSVSKCVGVWRCQFTRCGSWAPRALLSPTPAPCPLGSSVCLSHFLFLVCPSRLQRLAFSSQRSQGKGQWAEFDLSLTHQRGEEGRDF